MPLARSSPLRLPAWAPLALALAAACSAGPRPSSDGGAADAGLFHRTGLTQTHVPSCVDDSACGDGLEPPLGGPHCASPLPCREYPDAQNRCEYIHNLEHGHLVLAYNCPGGCPDVVAALHALWERQPQPRRALLTPDPKLPARVGALVWGWGWLGDAVDGAAIEGIIARQDVDAPERGLGCLP